MDEWLWSDPHAPARPAAPAYGALDVRRETGPQTDTAAGAEWPACAGPGGPASTGAAVPGVLPCGTVFDVVDLPALFGRRMLEQLRAAGQGCGPVAVHRGRLLVFAAPGTAQRLPALLGWEEWGRAVPPLLFHGTGDAVTVPPAHGPAPGAGARWVVAPGDRDPWLPGAAVLLWACLRAVRRTPAGTLPPWSAPPAAREPSRFPLPGT